MKKVIIGLVLSFSVTIGMASNELTFQDNDYQLLETSSYDVDIVYRVAAYIVNVEPDCVTILIVVYGSVDGGTEYVHTSGVSSIGDGCGGNANDTNLGNFVWNGGLYDIETVYNNDSFLRSQMLSQAKALFAPYDK